MLLNGSNEIKLADLDLSKQLDRSYAKTYAYMYSLAYMSPEVFKSKFTTTKYYPNTDIWYKVFLMRFCLC